MKVLLRNVQNGSFYSRHGIWTENPSDAWDFEQTDRALNAVSEFGLGGTEVLIRFENPFFEIPLKIVGVGA